MVRRLAVAVVLVLALAWGSAAPAGATSHPSAAEVVPLTSNLQTWGYYWAQVQYRIVGPAGRRYVDYFLLDATNETWPGTLEIEVRVIGPAGFATPWKLYGVNLGALVNMSVGENRDLTAGCYQGQFDIYGEPVTTSGCASLSGGP